MGKKLSVNELKKMFWFSRGQNVGIVKITPSVARKVLECNNDRNRKISNSVVKRLVSDIENGNFKLSNDFITFDEKGTLTNGQHRLKAISLSNVHICEVGIAFGINNFMGMDTGRVRTLQDNAIIFQNCDDRFKSEEAKICISIAKDVLHYNEGKYKSNSNYTQDYLMKVVNYLADDLYVCFKNGLFKLDKGVSSNPVLSAMLLAYQNGVDIDILKKIKRVLASGMPECIEKDAPILRLREKLISIKGGGSSQSEERHLLTQRCIYKVDKGYKTPSLDKCKYYYTKEIRIK